MSHRHTHSSQSPTPGTSHTCILPLISRAAQHNG